MLLGCPIKGHATLTPRYFHDSQEKEEKDYITSKNYTSEPGVVSQVCYPSILGSRGRKITSLRQDYGLWGDLSQEQLSQIKL